MCEQEGFIYKITVLDNPQPIKPEYLYCRSRKHIQFYKHVRRCWVSEVRCEEQQMQVSWRLTSQPPRGASRVTILGCALNSSGYQSGDSSQLFPLSEWDSTRTDSWSLSGTVDAWCSLKAGVPFLRSGTPIRWWWGCKSHRWGTCLRLTWSFYAQYLPVYWLSRMYRRVE